MKTPNVKSALNLPKTFKPTNLTSLMVKLTSMRTKKRRVLDALVAKQDKLRVQIFDFELTSLKPLFESKLNTPHSLQISWL